MHTPWWVNLVPWGLVQTVVAGIVATYILKPLYDHLQVQANSKVRADMQLAIKNALAFGVTKIKGSPADVFKDDELWNALIAAARDYLNENADGIMQKLGINPNSSAITKALEAQVLAVVNEFVWKQGTLTMVTGDPSVITRAAA